MHLTMDGMKHEGRRFSVYSLEKHGLPEKYTLVDKSKDSRCGNNSGHSYLMKTIKWKFRFSCCYSYLWHLHQISIWNLIIYCCHPLSNGLKWLNSFHSKSLCLKSGWLKYTFHSCAHMTTFSPVTTDLPFLPNLGKLTIWQAEKFSLEWTD